MVEITGLVTVLLIFLMYIQAMTNTNFSEILIVTRCIS